MSDSPQQTRPSLAEAHRFDLGIAGAGLLAFIGSFLPYYTVSVDMMGFSASVSANAWHGFLGWFGVLAAIVGSALVLTALLGAAAKVPFPVRTGALAAYAVAVLCTLLALFIGPGGGCQDLEVAGSNLCDGIDEGRGFGYWLTLLAVLGGLALCWLRRGADSEAA